MSKIFISLFLFVTVTAFFVFSFSILRRSGVILGEPDEFVHARIADDLPSRGLPIYGGAPFFYDLPGFFFAAALLVPKIQDPFFAVRLISYISTLLLGFSIFYYLRKKGISLLPSLFGTAFFLLNPFVVFYSQTGVIEPLLSFLSFSFLVFFDLSLKNDSLVFSILSGLFLAAAVLTKYTALYFLPLILIFFVFLSMKKNILEPLAFRKGFLILDLKTLIPLLTVGISVFPVLTYFYLRYPFELKSQMRQVLGLTNMAVFSLYKNIDLSFLKNLIWWFSPLLVLGSVFGLLLGVVFYRSRFGFLIANTVLVFTLISSRLPFYPRYALILAPFLSVLTAVGLSFFLNYVQIRTLKVIGVVFIAVIYLWMEMPVLKIAYESSKHHLVEKAVAYVNDLDRDKTAWIFSNYWPNIIGFTAGRTKTAWLTIDNREIAVFVPEEKRTGLEILKSEKVFILIEDYYSPRQIVANSPRYEAFKMVENNLKPAAVITDSQPNFPFSQETSNFIQVYRVGFLE